MFPTPSHCHPSPSVQPEQVVSLENTGSITLRQADHAHWDITVTLTLEFPLCGLGVQRQPAQQCTVVQLNIPFTRRWHVRQLLREDSTSRQRKWQMRLGFDYRDTYMSLKVLGYHLYTSTFTGSTSRSCETAGERRWRHSTAFCPALQQSECLQQHCSGLGGPPTPPKHTEVYTHRILPCYN